MSTLKLVLKKKWYDLINSGEKIEEYRQITPYWLCRVFDEDGLVKHERVIFYLGYAKERPSMEFRIEDVIIAQGNPVWGAEPGKKYVVIKLGTRVV